MKPLWPDVARTDALAPSDPAPHLPDGTSDLEMDAQDSCSMSALLRELVEAGGSDLHLTVGLPPRLRIDGELVNSRIADRALSPEQTLALASSLLNERQQAAFEATNELDFSFGIAGLARFRASVYRQRGAVGVAIRQIPYEIRGFDSLGLPAHVVDFAKHQNGLVLVTGSTGSGKSTTLAALIDRINHERKVHILTIEDPIEFVHHHGLAMVNQREVGTDTRSFASALKHALRQDPDVVLIGEMRDNETIAAAITTAETGHLVLATLHSNSAAESIDRMIDVFPPEQQPQIRTQLASVLEGIVTQQLLPRIGGGRALAAEVLVVTPAIRALIRDDKAHQIYTAMQAGSKHGMQTMNHSLLALHRTGAVSREEILSRSEDPEELRRMIQLVPGGFDGS
ncbi:MAG: type IV pilus twitching motility protein PilT [Gemmatimonadota bacterium]